MRLSIAAEMVLGALVVITAAYLASLTPGTHEQPVWPLPWRPSLAAFDDAGLRAELVPAVCAAVIGVAIAVIGVIWRRVRWLALGIAVVIEVWAMPHLDLLFVAAYPTSFFTSPTEFAATAIAHGCTTVRRELRRSATAPRREAMVRPRGRCRCRRPTSPRSHFRAHSDGELYWFISHGIRDARWCGQRCRASPVSLSSEAIWHLIDYLRAHNAGDALRRTGSWPQPLPMPQFDAQCANGQIIDLDDLRGHALRIIAVSDDERPEPPLPDDVDAVTVLVARNLAAKPTGAACVASEPQVWTALAIIVGLSPDALAGTQVLVDRNALAARRVAARRCRGLDRSTRSSLRGFATFSPIRLPSIRPRRTRTITDGRRRMPCRVVWCAACRSSTAGSSWSAPAAPGSHARAARSPRCRSSSSR